MKIKLAFMTLLSVITLISCTNEEYKFNEGMAQQFWIIKNSIDNLQDEFVSDNITSYSDALNDLKNTSSEALKKMKEDYQPSDIASDFYNKTIDYATLVNQDYVNNLQNLVNLSCDCPQTKDSLIHVANEIYKKIENAQDEALDIQIVYLQKAGLHK